MQKSELPVYQINNFAQDEHVGNLVFDIKNLEDLACAYECTHHPHRHDFYNVLIVTEGHGIHSIDFIDYEVNPCTIFFLTPGQVHYWDLAPGTKGYSLFFETHFYAYDQPLKRLKQFPFFGDNGSPYLQLDCDQSDFVKNIVGQMKEEFHGDKNQRDQVLRAYLEILLIKLNRFYKGDGQDTMSSPYLLQQVSHYENLVEENFIQYKSVQDYADMMAVTAKNLNAICKKAVGKTAGSIIKDRIMLEAKRLLMHSELSVNQIVAELNFKDPSYFVRFFRKNEGITPEHFRKNALKKSSS